jgi:hypothetical protein
MYYSGSASSSFKLFLKKSSELKNVLSYKIAIDIKESIRYSCIQLQKVLLRIVNN